MDMNPSSSASHLSESLYGMMFGDVSHILKSNETTEDLLHPEVVALLVKKLGERSFDIKVGREKFCLRYDIA
jgi:hypothetical protein